MATPLFPQEIYLLERYSSKEYFDAMRDAWEKMLQHAELSLDAFVRKLPLDYRSRPLPEQPDIVWGERVLPNLRATMDALNGGYIRLTHGEMQALGVAGMVRSDFAGITRDYTCDWMDEPQVVASVEGGSEKFWHWLSRAIQHAANIDITVGAYWKQGSLSTRYGEDARGALNPPQNWPRYAVDRTRSAITGAPVGHTGVYLPLVDDSCAAFMIQGTDAPPASVGYDPNTMQNTSEAGCDWQLVVRVEGEFVEEGTVDLLGAPAALVAERTRAGDVCMKSGWWYTPAQPGSRRYFNRDDTFPSIDSDYGETFWLWAQDQSPPTL